MCSPAGPFAIARDEALSGSAALAAAMELPAPRILVEVPVNQPVPYVVADQLQVILANGECADEATLYATIHWWARKTVRDRGVQARAMGAAIIEALNLQLTVTGWDVVEWVCEDERYNTDPDQSTHGQARLRYELTETVVESGA